MEKTVAEVIGKRLRMLRGKKTRRQMALDTGISYSALGNYECGVRIPEDDIKVRIAKYFGVKVEDIFFPKEYYSK